MEAAPALYKKQFADGIRYYISAEDYFLQSPKLKTLDAEDDARDRRSVSGGIDKNNAKLSRQYDEDRNNLSIRFAQSLTDLIDTFADRLRLNGDGTLFIDGKRPFPNLTGFSENLYARDRNVLGTFYDYVSEDPKLAPKFCKGNDDRLTMFTHAFGVITDVLAGINATIRPATKPTAFLAFQM